MVKKDNTLNDEKESNKKKEFKQDSELIDAVLDEDARNLVCYVCNLAKKSTDDNAPCYVVLMCRRWLIVYEIIRHAYFADFDEKRILCDDDLTPLEKDNNSRVMISDDIIIHGRTVMSMFDKINQKQHNTNVSAFFRKYDAEKLDLSIFEPLTGRSVTEWEWRNLSNRLIELIIKSKTPYTTFTYSFVTKTNKSLNIPTIGFVEISAENEKIFEDCGIQLKVHFAFSTENYPLLSGICSHVCIREYKYPDDSTIYIPFVFIPQIGKEIFNQLATHKEFPESVRDVFISDRSPEYKTRLLSFLLSYTYGRVTLKIDEENDKIDMDKMDVINSIISKSFISTFYDITMLSTEKCSEILMIPFSKNSVENVVTIDENNEKFFPFKKTDIQIGKSSRHIINEALAELHSKNEEKAKNSDGESLWGYRISDIIDGFNLDKCREYLVSLISQWDIGTGTYCFKEYGDYVYGTVSDGEQAYRIEYQRFKPYARTCFLLRKYSPFCHKKGEYLDFIKKSPVNDKLPSNFVDEFTNAEKFFEDKLSTELENMKNLKTVEWEELLYNQTQAFLSNI